MFEKRIVARELAISHLKNLPDDLLPSLGLSYLVRFYQYIYSSSLEKIIIHKSATCVITYNVETLWRRVIINTLPSFLCAIGSKLLDRQFRQYLWGCNKHCNFSPQIAFMFSDEKRAGHGSELLSQLSLSPLYVKTLQGGRAEQFYKKNGFTEIDFFEYAKRKYTLLIRV